MDDVRYQGPGGRDDARLPYTPLGRCDGVSFVLPRRGPPIGLKPDQITRRWIAGQYHWNERALLAHWPRRDGRPGWDAFEAAADLMRRCAAKGIINPADVGLMPVETARGLRFRPVPIPFRPKRRDEGRV